ncbi:hypothetical protein NP233_g8698 [Leucocoprinus birnbaumii]|uniref:RNA-binding S4 domain-containing protein n=1 Tax=Leucocoprinus birnbaumii TaxID=56174 RepID=A0AAD5VMF4_9AGAR|nr:hypothetical protein NP233_g8698 [Leucocoprinus birnbaumii]
MNTTADLDVVPMSKSPAILGISSLVAWEGLHNHSERLNKQSGGTVINNLIAVRKHSDAWTRDPADAVFHVPTPEDEWFYPESTNTYTIAKSSHNTDYLEHWFRFCEGSVQFEFAGVGSDLVLAIPLVLGFVKWAIVCLLSFSDTPECWAPVFERDLLLFLALNFSTFGRARRAGQSRILRLRPPAHKPLDPLSVRILKMRDQGVLNIKRALPRMSWSPKNLYNLWQRTMGPESKGLDFKYSPAKETLFQQRWLSKKLVRAYHGDYIAEKRFTRWYLPETIPDVRPRRAVKTGDDEASLAEYARRKGRSEESEKAIELKGMPPVGSLMFSEVERRIDTVIFRCCFAESIYDARRIVLHGNVMLNGKKHDNPNTRLAPGDMISVDPEAVRFLKPQPLPGKEWEDVNGYNKLEKPDPNHDTPFFLPHFASPHLFIPAYIEPSFSTCSAIYVRHPTARPGYSEVPTPYDADGAVVRYAWEWYVKRRPRIRSKKQLEGMPEDRAITTGLVDKESLIKQDRKKLQDDLKKVSALQRK